MLYILLNDQFIAVCSIVVCVYTVFSIYKCIFLILKTCDKKKKKIVVVCLGVLNKLMAFQFISVVNVDLIHE